MGDPNKWSEVLSPDGRVFFYHNSTGISQWEKPHYGKSGNTQELTYWREYKIWDGRSFFHNSLSKISVWAPPPEIEASFSDAVPVIADQDGSRMQLDAQTSRSSHLRCVFLSLLREYEIDNSHYFSDAMRRCSHDVRWHSLQSAEDQKQAFVEFVNSNRKLVSHVTRDAEKCHIKNMIIALQTRHEITEAYDYDSLAAWGKSQSWWLELSEIRKRSLFEQYVADYARVKSRDDRRNAEKHMNVLKKEIEKYPQIDYSVTFKDISCLLSSSASWTQLDEMQRVSVWRTCVAQYLRSVRASISAGEGHSSHQRTLRKSRDTIREKLLELFSEGSIDVWMDSAESVRQKISGSTCENIGVLDKAFSDMEIISKFLDNLRDGREPFSDLPKPVSHLREL